MNQIPKAGYLREKQILGDKKANPPIPAIIPIAHSSWWNGIRAGRYPAPVKLAPRTTAWRVEDILALIDNLNSIDQKQSGSAKPNASELAGPA